MTEQPKRRAALSTSGTPCHVAVVDDEPAVRRALERLLRSAGCRVTTFATGERARSQLVARYDLINRTAKPLTLTLVLAVRPYQVNPPAQFLNIVGGVSAIRDIAWDGAALSIDGRPRVFPLRPPSRVGAFSFRAGSVPRILAGEWSDTHRVHDDTGFASAALAYPFRLAPHASQRIGLVVPLSGPAATPTVDPTPDGRTQSAWLEREERTVAAAWK